jgi:transcriptional regulator with XRE-family HTH domain
MAFKRKKISQIRTVGNRLKQARKKKGLTLEEAESETKVRMKYLQAIESDNWQIFPNKIYVLGFVRRYARFIGLKEDDIVREFKREFGEYKGHPVKRIRQSGLIEGVIITPRFLVAIISSLLVLFVIGYIIFSTRSISKPPEIEILSPANEAVNQREIVIEGKTDSTAVVEINGQLVGVSDSGYFSQKVSLEEGVNNFKIISKNRIGRENAREVKIFYSPNPLPSATKTD